MNFNGYNLFAMVCQSQCITLAWWKLMMLIHIATAAAPRRPPLSVNCLTYLLEFRINLTSLLIQLITAWSADFVPWTELMEDGNGVLIRIVWRQQRASFSIKFSLFVCEILETSPMQPLTFYYSGSFFEDLEKLLRELAAWTARCQVQSNNYGTIWNRIHP